MTSITAYLRTPLFVPENGGNAPKQCMVITGTLQEGAPSGALRVHVEQWADQRGRALAGASATLLLPMSKIDHAVYHD
jgi:hypothetical protein